MFVISLFFRIFKPPNYVAYVITGMGSEIQRTKNRNKKSRRSLLQISSGIPLQQAEKRTDKITVGLFGKITEKEGFIPSEKHLLKKQAERDIDPAKVDIKMFGVYGLFSELLDE